MRFRLGAFGFFILAMPSFAGSLEDTKQNSYHVGKESSAPQKLSADRLDPSFVLYDKDAEIKIGARVKADFYVDFDGKQPRGTFGLDNAGIPLRKLDADASRKNHFNATLAASRFGLQAKKSFDDIHITGYLEGDFNSNASRTTNSYGFRARHAYGEFNDEGDLNNVLIGQTWTNFSCLEATPFTTDFVYPSFRTMQLKYTRKLLPNLTLSISGEKPNTQYYQYTDTSSNNGYFDNDDGGSNSKSSMPDATFRLKYQQGRNLVDFRGVFRSLEVKAIPGDAGYSLTQPYHKRQLGWGLGGSGVFHIFEPLTIMGQVQAGKGTGRYIDDLGNANAYDSFFQYPTMSNSTIQPKFKPVKQVNFIGGVTFSICDQWESNLGMGYTKISKPKNIVKLDALTPFSHQMSYLQRNLQRYYSNIIYRPFEKTYFLLEYEHMRRKAGYPILRKGWDNRIVFSLLQNF